MSEPTEPRPGLFGTLRKMLDTGLEYVQTRLQLIIVEAQEARARLVELAVMAAVGLILGTVGALALTAAVILALPPGWRAGVAAIFGLGYIVASALIFLRLHDRLKHSPPPFSQSLGEINKDREWLNSQL